MRILILLSRQNSALIDAWLTGLKMMLQRAIFSHIAALIVNLKFKLNNLLLQYVVENEWMGITVKYSERIGT